MQQRSQFGYFSEAFIYPLLLLLLLWMIQWMDYLSALDFYKFGLMPRTLSGLKGVFFMPLLHAQNDIHHLLNNSVVVYLLLALLLYFYREIALRVFVLCWILTGLFVWIYAQNRGAYHIGMSGVIYALLGFLFTSGVLRKHLSLQALSLLIVFLYGNMIWGIFPLRANVSWEGHFMGLLVGILLAFIYRKDAIQPQKYQYEIEEELLRAQEMRELNDDTIKKTSSSTVQSSTTSLKIVYHFRAKKS